LEKEVHRRLIFSHIEEAVCDLKGYPIVGVNGVDTSGKTVFAYDLERYLTAKGVHTLLLHVDDFHNPRAVRNRDPSALGYLNNGFDLHKLASVLREVKARPIDREIAVLDLDEDTFTKSIRLKTADRTVIIVEGVLLYRPPVAELIDYKVFLDISFDEVICRARLRDVPKYGEGILDKYKERYIPAQRIYLEQYRVKEICDLIVDNSNLDRPVII